MKFILRENRAYTIEQEIDIPISEIISTNSSEFINEVWEQFIENENYEEIGELKLVEHLDTYYGQLLDINRNVIIDDI